MPLTDADFERRRDLGGRRHGESEAQFMDRRLAESEARWAAQDAGIRAARAERERLGIPHPPPPMPYVRPDRGLDGSEIMGLPRRGPGWAS